MDTHQIPSHVDSLSDEMKLAARAASAAGKVIREGYGKLHQVQAKGVGDLVSDIDRLADEAAANVLNEGNRARPILSEELSPELDGVQDDFWIVDPLDGTSAFLFRTGGDYSSVLIALRQGDRTRLGIVHFPVTGEWFYAEAGQGAFQNGQPLKTDSLAELATGWVELNQYSDSSFETAQFALLRNRLRTPQGAPLVTQNAPYSGVAMRIADPTTFLVAAIHDNQPGHVKQAAWDIAAPQLILQEAGGIVVNFRGEPVDPFHPEPFLVASHSGIANSILALLEKNGQE